MFNLVGKCKRFIDRKFIRIVTKVEPITLHEESIADSTKVKTWCKACKKEIIDFKCRSRRFCSRECSKIFKNSDMIKTCKFCKTFFTSKKWEKKTFCCVVCANRFRRKEKNDG